MTSPGPTEARPFLLVARVLAVATIAVVVTLFGTAGRVVAAHELVDVHGFAAIALHVTLGGLMVATAGLAYARRRGWWTSALAGVAFVYSFIQAALGEGATIGIHILGSLIVVFSTVWLTAWLFSASAAATGPVSD